MRKIFISRESMFSALLAVAMAVNHLAFAQSAGDANAQTVTAIVSELQKHLDAEVAGNPSIPGELLHIISPKHKLDIPTQATFY